MRDSFSTYHPMVNFIYFAAVFVLSMLFMHPAYLGASLFCAAFYFFYIKGIRSLKTSFIFVIPTLFLIMLTNTFFAGSGNTELFHIGKYTATFEAMIYGLSTGIMFLSVIIWFLCLSEVITSDKFIFLFGRLVPSISVIFSLILRLIPRLKRQTKIITDARTSSGRGTDGKKLSQRTKGFLDVILILTMWSLENSIDTADSMKARGYGLPGRTSYCVYRYTARDKAALILIGVFAAAVIAGFICGAGRMEFYPAIETQPYSFLGICTYLAYFSLLMIPIAVNLADDLKFIAAMRKTQK